MQYNQLSNYVRSFQQGNQDAFSLLYEKTQQELYLYAVYIVKDQYSAEDLTQDTFVQIWKKIDTLRDPDRFLPWAKSIMYFKAMSNYRSSKNDAVLIDEEHENLFDSVADDEIDVLPEDKIIQDELKETVNMIMQQLPPDQAFALLAYYYDNMSVGEIASMIGCPEGTVKTRLYYGRKAFKQKLEKFETEHGVKVNGIKQLFNPKFGLFDDIKNTAYQISNRLLIRILNTVSNMHASIASVNRHTTICSSSPIDDVTSYSVEALSGTAQSPMISKQQSQLGKIAAGITITVTILGSAGAFAFSAYRDSNTQDQSVQSVLIKLPQQVAEEIKKELPKKEPAKTNKSNTPSSDPDNNQDRNNNQNNNQNENQSNQNNQDNTQTTNRNSDRNNNQNNIPDTVPEWFTSNDPTGNGETGESNNAEALRESIENGEFSISANKKAENMEATITLGSKKYTSQFNKDKNGNMYAIFKRKSAPDLFDPNNEGKTFYITYSDTKNKKYSKKTGPYYYGRSYQYENSGSFDLIVDSTKADYVSVIGRFDPTNTTYKLWINNKVYTKTKNPQETEDGYLLYSKKITEDQKISVRISFYDKKGREDGSTKKHTYKIKIKADGSLSIKEII